MLSTKEEFITTMNTMRHHAKTGNLISYPLQNQIFFDSFVEEELPIAAKNETRDFKLVVEKWNDSEKESISEECTKLKEKKMTEAEFRKKMQDNKEEAKKKANKAIDGYYDNMIDVGISTGKYAIIESVTALVTNFFLGLISKIGEFIRKLIVSIIDWAKRVYETFKKTVKATYNFFVGVFKLYGIPEKA